eukprot:CAMPEP_0119187178 /NCGR_PEP_ID=MMETSP1315-20130426/69393_1 /TAXON_ID=676789 /ORGANISM="Prasinoderma singularis, Strain RCC927" /LENGTH=148 /DNA_ID=CAMNT_0007181619 /DNA_START=262 /DNA_END=705 /DNA_ORIENTATION=+
MPKNPTADPKLKVGKPGLPAAAGAGRAPWQSRRHRPVATPPPAQPRYSSPPAPRALATAPDGVVGAAGLRAAAAVGDYKSANLVFPPPPAQGAPPGNPVGTVLYPGALVDPVSYSPLARALAAATGGAVVVPVFAGDLPADRTGERAA